MSSMLMSCSKKLLSSPADPRANEITNEMMITLHKCRYFIATEITRNQGCFFPHTDHAKEEMRVLFRTIDRNSGHFVYT